MKPNLSKLFIGLSALACIGLAIGWVRSYFRIDHFSHVGVQFEQELDSDTGRIMYRIEDFPHPGPRSNGRWFHHVYTFDPSDPTWHIWSDDLANASWSWEHFEFAVATDRSKDDITIVVPYLFLVLITGAAPTMAVVRRLRRRGWQEQGHCADCGYDLRGTPYRCPECGRVPRAQQKNHGTI